MAYLIGRKILPQSVKLNISWKSWIICKGEQNNNPICPWI